MPEPLRIGLAGLGTVGAGVVRMLQTHGQSIAARAGRPVEIAAVSARSRHRDRGVDLSGYGWEDDPVALARRADVDLVVEVMGGEDGPARATALAAIAAGKHLVTANKAMLARHGQALAEAAEAAGVALRFEAAVAGGIPVVKALAEGLAGNRVTRLMGVLNGTCNYILTRMEAEDAPYAPGARGGAAARLRRGRPGLRRGRDRRGAEARAPRRHRLRLAGWTSRRDQRRGDRAGEPRRHRARGGARLSHPAARGGADDRGGAGGADAALPGAGGLAAGAARPASPTWWWSRATSSGGSC